MKIGYFLSSEEFGPKELVEHAKKAEQAGFHALWISDHYHPWNDEQGHSPFVWSVIGALAEAVDLPVTTGVTCPTIRIHPAIIAQAAATSAVMTGGCFNLGVGSGEALNEHILGGHWPEAAGRPRGGGRRAARDAARGGRGDAHAGARRAAVPQRQALHGRERARLRPAGIPGSRLRLRLRAQGDRARRGDRRRLRDHLTGQGRDRAVPLGRRQGPGARGDEGVLHGLRGGGAEARAPAVAERGAARRAGADPPDALALRAGVRAGHP